MLMKIAIDKTMTYCSETQVKYNYVKCRTILVNTVTNIFKIDF